MKFRFPRPEWFNFRFSRELKAFLHHYIKEIAVALALAIVAAIIIDPIWSKREQRLKHDTLARNLEAVATIDALDKQGNTLGQGSGFFITTNGILVTNYHVINGAANVIAHLPSGAFYTLKGYRDIDEKVDVAILQFDARETPSVSGPGDSDKLEVGDDVYAIGAPVGLESTVSAGTVSDPLRAIGGRSFIQFTAAISPGSSGGGLFNKDGEVVGVTAASKNIDGGPQAGSAQNLNLAVPINSVKNVLSGGANDLQRMSPAFYYSLGNLADNRSQWDKAIGFYRKALALDDQYTDAYVGLGGDYYEEGKFNFEVTNYLSATQSDPTDRDAFYLLATAYEDTGQYDDAVVAYKKALAIDPNYKDALHDLTIVFLTLGKVDKARELLPRLMAVDKGWGNELQILSQRIKE